MRICIWKEIYSWVQLIHTIQMQDTRTHALEIENRQPQCHIAYRERLLHVVDLLERIAFLLSNSVTWTCIWVISVKTGWFSAALYQSIKGPITFCDNVFMGRRVVVGEVVGQFHQLYTVLSARFLCYVSGWTAHNVSLVYQMPWIPSTISPSRFSLRIWNYLPVIGDHQLSPILRHKKLTAPRYNSVIYAINIYWRIRRRCKRILFYLPEIFASYC